MLAHSRRPQILRRFIGVLIAVLPMWHCADRSESLFSDAERALAADDFDAAARLFREVTILSPQSPLSAQALYELARIAYFQKRDPDEAGESLIKLLADHPEADVVLPARHLLRASTRTTWTIRPKALVQHEAILVHDTSPDVRRATLIAIGHCYYRLNDLASAADAYGRAIALPYDPSVDSAYLRLANITWLASSPETSLELLRELSSRTADADYRQDALLREVEVLMGLGRFTEARARLREFEETLRDPTSVAELQARLQSTEQAHQSLDGEAGEALLQELQKKIRWGGGRRRRPRAQ